MTPPDCDLRGLPFMPVDIVRLFDSDLYALSTGDEFKAALSLWGKSFLQVPAGSLPDDDRVLAHLSGAGARWKKVKAMALRGFVKCSDGRLYHPVVCEKAIEAWSRREDYREAQGNKSDRQRRWRERVKQMCERLREMGKTPPPGASLETLERLLEGAHVDAKETGKTGTVTGTVKGQGQLYSDARASARRPAQGDLLPSELVPDPRKAIFGDGLAWLIAKTARQESGVRAMLGRWSKQRGDPELAAALIAAQQHDPHDAISWIEARLNSNGQRKPSDLDNRRATADAIDQVVAEAEARRRGMGH